MVLGAVNAGLTARVASVLGRRAALVAGGFMAVWVHAVYVDRTTVLEPVGTLAILVALLLLRPVRPRRQLRDAHAQVLAGVALGAGTCVKVWGVVPLGVVALVLLLGRGWRAALRLALGAAAAGLLVVGPFLLAAPGATVRMIVLDQAGRPGFGWSPIERLPAIVGVVPYLSNEQRVAVAAVTAVVGPILVLLTALALRATAARLWVALLLANGLVLLAAPGYFPHYAAFLAVPLALVLGASAAVLSRRLRLHGSRPLQRAVAGAAVVTFVLLGLVTAAEPLGVRYPGERLAAFVPEDGCVRADDPSALIQLDVLSRNLRRGCTVPVDFSGITYDRLARERPDGSPVLREQNTAWQQYARDHLTSGSATVLIREEPGYDETTLRIFGSLPVLGRVGRWTVLGPPRAP
jgi:hypothetical protein